MPMKPLYLATCRRPGGRRHARSVRRMSRRRPGQGNSRRRLRSRQSGRQRSGGAGGRLLLGPAGRVRACQRRDQGGGRLFRRRQGTADYDRGQHRRPPAMPNRSQITFDPKQVSFGQLLRIYFSVAHDPTELNRQGPDAGHPVPFRDFRRQPGAGKPPPRPISPSSMRRIFSPHPSPPRSSRSRASTRPRTITRTICSITPTAAYIRINDLPKIAGSEAGLAGLLPAKSRSCWPQKSARSFCPLRDRYLAETGKSGRRPADGRFLCRSDLVGHAPACCPRTANWRFLRAKSKEIKAKPNHEN